ncbi:hypothetical protein B0H17DRAFT_1051919 [Mycena rosella]|uniref:Uncharacterized protein n=1 Tax=Mycena rosella TaxID=1033263 RepID=A0AAD7DS19_MYCRO|nr:hypothetical protein B0H17DRAFT_1051919 [Mycena rosella]
MDWNAETRNSTKKTQNNANKRGLAGEWGGSTWFACGDGDGDSPQSLLRYAYIGLVGSDTNQRGRGGREAWTSHRGSSRPESSVQLAKGRKDGCVIPTHGESEQAPERQIARPPGICQSAIAHMSGDNGDIPSEPAAAANG